MRSITTVREALQMGVIKWAGFTKWAGSPGGVEGTEFMFVQATRAQTPKRNKQRSPRGAIVFFYFQRVIFSLKINFRSSR